MRLQGAQRYYDCGWFQAESDSLDEDLMAGLADASDANYYYVQDAEKLPEILGVVEERSHGGVERCMKNWYCSCGRATIVVDFPPVEALQVKLEILGKRRMNG